MAIDFLLIYLILVVFSLIPVAFFTLLERRVLGNFHVRFGPMMVGPWGLFQPFSDAIKLFCSGDTLLRNVGVFYWGFSPFLSLVLYLTMLVGFPGGGGAFFLENLYLFFICLLSVSVYFLMFGGYYSGSKYSIIGGYRSVSQMISYEVVLIFMFVCFFFLVESWNLSFKNYEYLGLNFCFCLPFFFCWLLVMLVESNRLPYDFLEGESELVSGFNTEFWGGYFSFFFIFEYGSMMLFAIVTGFFLFSGLFSVFIFIFVVYFFLWVRSTVPRFRYDFLMDLAWKKFLLFSISVLLYVILL